MFTTDNEVAEFNLQPCKSCGRQFHAEILSRHFPICEKVKSKPRKLSYEKSGQLKRTDVSISNEVEAGEIVTSDGATLEDQKTIGDDSEHNDQQNNAESRIFID